MYKFRYALATHGRLIILVCGVVTLLALAGAGITYANPPTTEVTNTADEQTIATSLQTRAVVTEDSTLYSEGEVLTDQPVYLRSATPTATVSAQTTVPDERDVHVEQTLTLIFEVQSSSGDVFWERTQPLANDAANVEDGDFTTNATLDIADLAEQQQAIESDVGDAGRTTIYLRVETAYETPAYQGTITDRGEITIESRSYQIEPISMQERHSSSEPETRPKLSAVTLFEGPLIGTMILPHWTMILLVIGLIGGGFTAASVRISRGIDPETERAALYKARYAEWISQGSIPPLDTHYIIPIVSLDELVDVAIDANKRVVYDAEQRCYAVFDGPYAYIYLDETADV